MEGISESSGSPAGKDRNITLTQAFAREVSTRRNNRGLTQEELAVIAGIDRSTLTRLEKGDRGVTLECANKIAHGLGNKLSDMIIGAENKCDRKPEGDLLGLSEIHHISQKYCYNQDKLLRLGFSTSSFLEAVNQTYEIIDAIDKRLVSIGADRLSHLVELANLSSMLGNILGAAFAVSSDGIYRRNKPNTYPDLLSENTSQYAHIEIKTALENNGLKGHLPKEGQYLTFRYVLASDDGTYIKGRNNRGSAIWIWEIRTGYLQPSDFSISNTPGDSGKTAVIRADGMSKLNILYFDPRYSPWSDKKKKEVLAALTNVN